jgi:hypothetical protein
MNNNPYATNRGGKIEAPKKNPTPIRSTVEKGDDLRAGKTKKGKE